MAAPENILAYPTGVLTMSESGDAEKPHRLRWIARDGRTFAKDYGSLGYSQVMQEGPEKAASLMDMAAGDKAHDLSALEEGVVRLAAERCADHDGIVSEDRVAAFAAKQGWGYSQARDYVTRVLNGNDAEDDGYALIQAFATTHDLDFSDAASRLADAGAIGGDGLASTGSAPATVTGEATFSDADVHVRMEATGTSYAEAAMALAQEQD